MDGYLEETNKNKYLALLLTNESKEKGKETEELWSKTMDLISPITKNSDDYDGKCLKIKFASKDSVNKTIEVHNAQLVVRADFHEKKQIFSASFLRLMPIWIINNIKLLYYDIIDVSEGTDVNKTNESKVCDICH